MKFFFAFLLGILFTTGCTKSEKTIGTIKRGRFSPVGYNVSLNGKYDSWQIRIKTAETPAEIPGTVNVRITNQSKETLSIRYAYDPNIQLQPGETKTVYQGAFSNFVAQSRLPTGIRCQVVRQPVSFRIDFAPDSEFSINSDLEIIAKRQPFGF